MNLVILIVPDSVHLHLFDVSYLNVGYLWKLLDIFLAENSLNLLLLCVPLSGYKRLYVERELFLPLLISQSLRSTPIENVRN